MFDLQIHPRDHDLILATHGRSFMIMDDITALEEMNDQTLSADLKLFSGRPGIEWKMADYRSFIGSELFLAPNAPSGVLLDYYAKTAGPVRITIADKSGAPGSSNECARRSRRSQPRGLGYARRSARPASCQRRSGSRWRRRAAAAVDAAEEAADAVARRRRGGGDAPGRRAGGRRRGRTCR